MNFEGQTTRALSFVFSFADEHADKEVALQRIVDSCCNELEKNRHLKPEKEKSEDQLTIEIVSNLKILGLDAAHDKQQGGHCDILVEGRNGFVWIAEAKKHSSYDWLDSGFKQLSTRYSTGTVGQDSGEVMIYCWAKSSKSILETWRQKLIESHPDVIVDEKVDDKNLIFNSRHAHSSTGRDFRVRHKIVSLHFEPEA